ncbi:hypothetical protein QKU48_gp0582 [Fadolivirus algeromassiliense]|jgi:predicted HAD superfamily phosphohydrolase YqeG|uniref:Uncharacterized protein n=1 Tax=Fadolivirus FV1/VV64 TaxID=3070911 RepID=A0A7D3QX11_9VIRU|nr:hypothetical protein QKU48_gp0582 [Fadolivirus algeromassiliense]QKF94040.1 hypothetical protein Fadolivirus_1_582 [Fadolivirus FV1/VV64]
MLKVRKINEIELNKLIFEYNEGIIHIEYEGNTLIFETPDLYFNDPIKTNRTGYSTHELIITMNGKSNKITNECITFFNDLDNKIIEECKNNITNWLIKNDQLLYKSVLKQVEDPAECYCNGVIKIKFINDKNFKTMVFDNDNKIINTKDYIKSMTGNGYVKLILELISLTITNNIIHVNLKLHQVKLNNYNILNNGNNTNDNDEDSDIEYILSD